MKTLEEIIQWHRDQAELLRWTGDESIKHWQAARCLSDILAERRDKDAHPDDAKLHAAAREVPNG